MKGELLWCLCLCLLFGCASRTDSTSTHAPRASVLIIWTDAGCVAVSNEGAVGWSFGDEANQQALVFLPTPQSRAREFIKRFGASACCGDRSIEGSTAELWIPDGDTGYKEVQIRQEEVRRWVSDIIVITRLHLARAVHAKAGGDWYRRNGQEVEAVCKYRIALTALHKWMRSNAHVGVYDGELMFAPIDEGGLAKAYVDTWQSLIGEQLAIRDDATGIAVEFTRWDPSATNRRGPESGPGVIGVGGGVYLAGGEPYNVAPEAQELLRHHLLKCMKKRSEGRGIGSLYLEFEGQIPQ